MSSTIPLTSMRQRNRAQRRKSFIIRSEPELYRKRRRQEERVRWNRGHAWMVWRFLLGTVACFEFLIYLHEKLTYVVPEVVPRRKRWDLFFRRNEVIDEPTIESAVASLVSPWLTFFYTLYFFDSFIQAFDIRSRTFRTNEKERLLRGGKRKISTSIAFAGTLMFYLFLLPTWYWWKLARLFRVTGLFTPSELMKQSIIANPQYSLAYALFVYGSKQLSANAKAELKEQLRAYAKRQLRRVSMFAISNPRKFRRRYQTVSTTIFWVKYLQSVGRHISSSGLIETVNDVLKTWRQGIQKQQHRRQKRRKWKRLDSGSKREVAAVMIQRNYRSYLIRKWIRLVRLQEEKREARMILLVQKAIKRRSQVEFEEREQALEELELLRQQERQRQRSPRLRKQFSFGEIQATSSRFDEDDLRRQYQLQEETEQRIKAEKERLMLLRPDSTFVFRYQIVYLACAIVESLRIALEPWLDNDAALEEEIIGQRMFVLILFHSQLFTHVVLCFGIIVWVFIGVPDPATGRLVHRSLLDRWFYAWLLMQVFMNPALLEIKYVVKFIGRAGPGRVCRWWVMLFFPVWMRVISWVEWHVWMRLVERENQRLVTAASSEWMSHMSFMYSGIRQ